VSVLRFLLDNGAKLAARDKQQATALHRAAATGKVPAIECLLEAGANIETEDKLQQTPIILAANGQHKQAAIFLLEKGADPTKEDKEGECAFSVAPEELRNVLLQHWRQLQKDAGEQ